MPTSQKDWKQPNSRTECLNFAFLEWRLKSRLILNLHVEISLFIKGTKNSKYYGEKWFVHTHLSAGASRP